MLLAPEDQDDRFRRTRSGSSSAGVAGSGSATVSKRSMAMASGPTPRPTQRRLDQVHERPRAADVEVGIEAAVDEGGDGGAVDEAGLPVEVVANLEPAGVLGPAAPRAAAWKMTDSRSRLAYSRRTDRAEVASTLLAIESTGVIPLPPQKATIGRPPSRTQKLPDGGLTSTRSPSVTWSTSQLETEATRHPLDGEGQVTVGLRGARHRVATGVLDLPQVDPERAELPGPVREGPPEIVRHVEHERPRRPPSPRTTCLTRRAW